MTRSTRPSLATRASLRVIRFIVWLGFFSCLARCPATRHLLSECPTAAGKSPPASGVSVGTVGGRKSWVITCSAGQKRCERCPRLHALRQAAAVQVLREENHALVGATKKKAEPGDGDSEVTTVGNLDRHTLCPALMQCADRHDADANPVAVETTPSVHNAEDGPKQAKGCSADRGDQSDAVSIQGHTLVKPNILIHRNRPAKDKRAGLDGCDWRRASWAHRGVAYRAAKGQSEFVFCRNDMTALSFPCRAV